VAPRRIAVFNCNETHRDPRVRRVSETLAAAGNEVRVFEMRQGSAPATGQLGPFTVERVEVPQSYTVDDMAALADTCPAAGSILRRCDPMVMDGPGGARLQVLWRRARAWLGKRLRSPHRNGAPAAPRAFDPLQEILAIRSILLVDLELFRHADRWQPDLVYCNDLDTLLTGFMLKQIRGCPVIYDAHEIYPEQLAEHMRSDIWHGFYTRLEQALIQHTDARLTVCDSIGRWFEREYGCGPVVTLRNVPSIRHLVAPELLERRNQPVRFLYHGAYFAYRGLDEIIDVAARVDGARFVFRGIGGYLGQLQRQVAAKGLEHRVAFEDPVAVDDLIATASANDVGLNPFVSVCKNTEFALPNKFFEYMMAGLAVASADLVEMRALTRELDIGVLYDPTDADSLAAALNRLCADADWRQACRQRAFAAARAEFHWEHEEGKLRRLLQQVS
jgi:glycosyltransferase involved in cell wall biosynthesis